MPSFKSGGVRLHYVRLGKAAGAPVLLIHGIQGRAALWEPVARRLAAQGIRPFGIDLRGHGSSDRAADHSPGAYCSDVIALIERLAVGPMHLVGHSLGGRIAWEVAAARPDLVQRLVLEDQHPNANPNAMPYWEDWATHWPLRFASKAEGVQYLQAHALRLQWWEPSLVPQADGSWTWAFDVHGVVATVRAFTAREGWTSLSRVQAPTLLIRGGTSEHLTPEVAERMVATLRNGRLLTVPGIGHWVHREAEPYAAAIAAFLREG